MSLMAQAPVVFLQYLAALAIVEGVQTYDKGYQRIPVRLKWPNDICETSQPHRMTTTNNTPPQI